MVDRQRLPWPTLAAPIGLAAVSTWLAVHRRSAAVRGWRPSMGRHERIGPLSVRTLHGSSGGVLLLHGLLASSDSFGRAFDAAAANGRTVAVPDLLGFGRSSGPTETDFTLDRHLHSLDRVARRLGLLDGPLVVAGHSLGGILAIEWAARHAGQVD